MPTDKSTVSLGLDTAKTLAASGKAAPSLRRPWTRRVSLALLPLALIGGCYWNVIDGQVTTDDVEAETVGISTKVSGIVQEIDVTDNQHVEAGQVLYRLDPRQFQITLGNARASLAETALTVETVKQDYRRMLRDVAAQEAQVSLDQTNYSDNAMVPRSAPVSQADYDQTQSTLEVDTDKLEALRHLAQAQLARLAGCLDLPMTEDPQYLQAQAHVDEAQRQLDETVVRAPFSGTVVDAASIAPGDYLAASTTAFYLVEGMTSGWTQLRKRQN
jgi:membrane fusion protein, multidrug efflux system